MQTTLELYQLVTPLSGLGIWERNFVTGVVYWNSVIRTILEADENTQMELADSLQLYKEPELIKELIDDAIASGTPKSAELQLYTLKGNLIWIKINLQAGYENGICINLHGTLQDITSEIKLRKRSDEHEKRFSQAFAHAPNGIALVSLKGEWISANKSLTELLGYTEAELIGHKFHEFTHPEDLQIDLVKMEELLNQQSSAYSIEKRYFHKSGHVIWTTLNVSLVRDDHGKPLYFISQLKDVTERRKNMQIINDQNSRLLNFAHIVSHNLRSHTGNIRMIATMVMEEQDAAEKNNLLQMLAINTDNLLETLTNLNEIVKIHDNGLNNRKVLQLSEQIDRSVHILSASIKMENASVEIDVAPEISLMLNPAYIESILINLLSNSLKYRSLDIEPRIKISARETHGKITIQVSDNGIGIDLNLHGHKLFGMYKTFHDNDDARGMGLFLVKNQVESMGGKITAASELGKGSTFTIKLDKY